MTDPIDDCEKLLEHALNLAEELLLEQEEFYPFGIVMKTNGEILHVAALGEGERPPSSELIDIIKHGFQEAAKKKKYKATAMGYDVRIDAKNGGKTDAIAVNLDHVEDYSAVVYTPYKLTKKLLKFGQAEEDEGSYEIFGNN